MNSTTLIGPKTSTNGRRDASEFGGWREVQSAREATYYAGRCAGMPSGTTDVWGYGHRLPLGTNPSHRLAPRRRHCERI